MESTLAFSPVLFMSPTRKTQPILIYFSQIQRHIVFVLRKPEYIKIRTSPNISLSLISPMLRRSLLRRLNCKANGSQVFLSPFYIRKYNDENLTPPLRYSIASSAKPFSHQSWHTQNSGSVSGLPIIDDTIYALSTAQGRAGIAVIRISGPSCLEVSVIQITI